MLGCVAGQALRKDVVKAKRPENRDSLGELLVPTKLILQNRSGFQGPRANRGLVPLRTSPGRGWC